MKEITIKFGSDLTEEEMKKLKGQIVYFLVDDSLISNKTISFDVNYK